MPDRIPVVGSRLLATATAGFVGPPHTVDTFVGAAAPAAAVTSAFVMCRTPGFTLLARVSGADRGWDVPGGHREPGEDPAATAVRELREETGFSLSESDLRVVGWQRISLFEAPPLGYRYPQVSYQMFFGASVSRRRARCRVMPAFSRVGLPMARCHSCALVGCGWRCGGMSVGYNRALAVIPLLGIAVSGDLLPAPPDPLPRKARPPVRIPLPASECAA